MGNPLLDLFSAKFGVEAFLYIRIYYFVPLFLFVLYSFNPRVTFMAR